MVAEQATSSNPPQSSPKPLEGLEASLEETAAGGKSSLHKHFTDLGLSHKESRPAIAGGKVHIYSKEGDHHDAVVKHFRAQGYAGKKKRKQSPFDHSKDTTLVHPDRPHHRLVVHHSPNYSKTSVTHLLRPKGKATATLETSAMTATQTKTPAGLDSLAAYVEETAAPAAKGKKATSPSHHHDAFEKMGLGHANTTRISNKNVPKAKPSVIHHYNVGEKKKPKANDLIAHLAQQGYKATKPRKFAGLHHVTLTNGSHRVNVAHDGKHAMSVTHTRPQGVYNKATPKKAPAKK